MTKFSDFIRNASSEEKGEVYRRVIRKVHEDQQRTIRAFARTKRKFDKAMQELAK